MGVPSAFAGAPHFSRGRPGAMPKRADGTSPDGRVKAKVALGPVVRSGAGAGQVAERKDDVALLFHCIPLGRARGVIRLGRIRARFEATLQIPDSPAVP